MKLAYSSVTPEVKSMPLAWVGPPDEVLPAIAAIGYQGVEFQTQNPAEIDVPKLNRKALVQAHCHHASVLHFNDEETVLKQMGLDVEHPDSGCCGMAGAFGFEKEKYEVSMRVGERMLLPKVREAPRDTLIVADGFSCREQIAQSTNREALHLAQVLQMALREGPAGPKGDLPERHYIDEQRGPDLRKVGAVAGGLLLFGGIIWLARRWRRRVSSRAAKNAG